MPLLLSRYVWENMGTIFAHGCRTFESLEVTMDAIGGSPLRQVGRPEDSNIVEQTLPEESQPIVGAQGNHLVIGSTFSWYGFSSD